MKVQVIHGAQISIHILDVSPRRIAVAYLGADWREYVPEVGLLEAVVVAPVLGTNPWAVLDLVKCLSMSGEDGWERIHFLDNLHAKLYLGKDSAVWGSPNLSKNGLSGERLVELASYSGDPEALSALSSFFEATLDAAKAQYPRTLDRKQRIDDLLSETLKNVTFARSYIPKKTTQFQDFESLSSDSFYICWYTPELPDGTIGDGVPDGHEVVFNDFGHFHPSDGIKPGKWILFWRLTSDYKPHKLVAPHWMMVDEVFPDGFSPNEPYPYTTVAYQREELDTVERARQQPFEITSDVAAALRSALVEPGLAAPLIQGDEIRRGGHYSVPVAQKALPALLERMKSFFVSSPDVSSTGEKDKGPAVASPSGAFGTVFLFPILRTDEERADLYDATRQYWLVSEAHRKRPGAIALGIKAMASVTGFSIESWAPAGGKFEFSGTPLPAAHELVGRSFEPIIRRALGYWQRGQFLVVEFDGKGQYRFVRGSKNKEHWFPLNG